MDAIILAGGFGTRLKDVIGDIPKPLALINGIPFLDILISKLQSDAKIENIILSVGYKKEKIMGRYKNLKNIQFCEEDSPLGTGGAIKKGLKTAGSQNVLILNGDTYVDFNSNELLDFHSKKNADITVLSNKIENVSRYGSLKIDPKTKRILSFDEKKENDKNVNGYINAGVYLMKKNVFDDFLFDSFSIEKDFFPHSISSKNIFSYQTSSFFIDIGTKESFLEAQKLIKF
ncbi:MAG: sugar phosphate nucleotidyltransferase [Parachlamydiales bacterium]|jgi:D-glycero-alpha-D-manno-heptose 1-phosphate guanylyltransferase